MVCSSGRLCSGTYGLVVATNAGMFTNTAPGVYEYGPTVATSLTTALRGLLFTPVENLLPIGVDKQVHIHIQLDDGYVGAVATRSDQAPRINYNDNWHFDDHAV